MKQESFHAHRLHEICNDLATLLDFSFDATPLYVRDTLIIPSWYRQLAPLETLEKASDYRIFDLLGIYEAEIDPDSGRIVIYRAAIEKCAAELERDADMLEYVVTVHEAAHAVTHLGKQDVRCFGVNSFPEKNKDRLPWMFFGTDSIDRLQRVEGAAQAATLMFLTDRKLWEHLDLFWQLSKKTAPEYCPRSFLVDLLLRSCRSTPPEHLKDSDLESLSSQPNALTQVRPHIAYDDDICERALKSGPSQGLLEEVKRRSQKTIKKNSNIVMGSKFGMFDDE